MDKEKNLNFTNVKLSIETRQDTANPKPEPLVVKYKRVGFFDYGFGLVDPLKEKSLFFLSITENEYSDKILKIKACDIDNHKKVLCVNNRGAEKNIFGYNSKGDYLFVERIDKEDFKLNNMNKVYIYGLDQSATPARRYWWGRENDVLHGFLDEKKRTIFDMFMLEKL